MTKTGRDRRRFDRFEAQLGKRYQDFGDFQVEKAVTVAVRGYYQLGIANLTFNERKNRKTRRAWWKLEKARLGL